MKNDEKMKHAWQQWVCFKLGNEEFGVNILKVREIVRIQSITHVPQTPATVAGVINLRGNVIPVIDLPKKLGLSESKRDDKARIIVFFVGDKLIGMIVDVVERVLRVRDDQIEPPPDIGAGTIQDYISGMGKIEEDIIILLNIEKILTEEEIIQMEDLKKIKNSAEEAVEKTEQPPKKKPAEVITKPAPKTVSSKSSPIPDPKTGSSKSSPKPAPKKQTIVKKKTEKTKKK